ncbi:MAG: DNA repair protein RadC [Pseudomonadota bacterium]|nr:DNA repair protein RadC [Pseudomonadota bacterium]
MKQHNIIPNTTGHRDRVQDKFLQIRDTSVLQDYELLELILMKAIPRIDVKGLAKDLINRFGSLNKVLGASNEELMAFPHIKKSALVLFKLIRVTNERLLTNTLKTNPVLEKWEQVVDYCCLCLQQEHIEHFMALYLDRQFRLIQRETPHAGTVDRVSFYPREILKQALVLGASAVVIVHNHPSGCMQPSPADVSLTTELYQLLRAAQIAFLDHLIIGENRKVYSFVEHGLLKV